MQTRRLNHWIELGFWQLAVRVLSVVRPLSPLISQAAQYVEQHPLPRRWPSQSALALGGWVCGLALGYWLAQAWF